MPPESLRRRLEPALRVDGMKQSVHIAEPHSAYPLDGVWHNRSAADVLTQVRLPTAELSAQDAALRLKIDQPNELKQGKR